MRIHLMFVAAAALASLAPAQHELRRPAPFHWEADLASASALSKQTGKPVVAYFTFET